MFSMESFAKSRKLKSPQQAVISATPHDGSLPFLGWNFSCFLLDRLVWKIEKHGGKENEKGDNNFEEIE